MSKKMIPFLLLAILMLPLSACAGQTTASTQEASPTLEVTSPESASDISTPEVEVSSDDSSRPAGWSEDTHSNDADPNYEVVFPEDEVNQLTITISPEDWETMQANMTELFGEDGSGEVARGRQPAMGNRPQPGEGGFPEDYEPPAEDERPERPEDFVPPEDGEQPEFPEGAPAGGRPGGGGFGGGKLSSENPVWVPATIEFEGNTWTNVGVRYKGNSSLTGGWRTGTDKLPFKLDFDEFEDEYPEIDDQRFYGFKQLSLANTYQDASLMRDAVAAQIYEDAGLPVAETAFYEVIIDYGEGPVSLGLYTMIEVIDDTVVNRYFGSDDGNIYEGEGAAASFAANTYGQIEASFEKENNEEEADWGDIENLFDVLHDDLRTSDPSAWRAELEAIFDTDAFLEWLAISAVIEHWDAYGSMTHNYYLYNDPETEQITWITWDHNETLSSTAGGRNRSVSLDKAEIGENWPLIRYLLDDPVYYDIYTDYLAETIMDAFQADKMTETYQRLADLIAPYAAKDVGEATFNNAVQELIDYTHQRTNDVETFLSSLEK